MQSLKTLCGWKEEGNMFFFAALIILSPNEKITKKKHNIEPQHAAKISEGLLSQTDWSELKVWYMEFQIFKLAPTKFYYTHASGDVSDPFPKLDSSDNILLFLLHIILEREKQWSFCGLLD